MNTYAIGDIHGCRRSLETLANAISFDSKDRIVLLGDYIDRGDDSKGALEWIITLAESHDVVALRGNHEVMMLEARQDTLKANLWSSYGGFETLLSYGAETIDDWVSSIPENHWRFLKSTRNYFESETHLFVHGKLRFDRDLADQDPYTMIWDKCHDMKPHQSGKSIVCGHTPQIGGHPGVYDWGVCIDTGAHKGGWLTCLNPGTGEYWQTNELGQIRSDWVPKTV